ncbi:hypothetical protein PM3016_5430 [Paenibacillus mucilaginosus 3016]|uniref:Phage protein Gp138 N-terminal domain-containing protein n=1 Tax=Paenibacillus mucilaginosus 3016 TaxID=1116391 RepID=H6NDT1_9BACL|nr:Gp138 family membrane-puncturing spike protein [Paenibacillus mucilaginosus]AFC32130.1 hypothetical protein PM3016_5430 [Paenibacillus mucilaginosus 3016]WFA20633.1 hypothetical protein ERY13_27030 [Paenibacillus mucilaginosus]
MGDFENMLRSMIDRAVLNLHTAQLCRVLSFDSGSLTCDLQPLFQQVRIDGTAFTLPPITNAPCLRQRYRVEGGEVREYSPHYQAGDIVLTVVAERAIDHVLAGQPADPKINRTHHLSDAIVIGVIGG